MRSATEPPRSRLRRPEQAEARNAVSVGRVQKTRIDAKEQVCVPEGGDGDGQRLMKGDDPTVECAQTERIGTRAEGDRVVFAVRAQELRQHFAPALDRPA